MTPPDPDTRELVSYLTLRRIVGILGVALPVLLAVWSLAHRIGLLPSISDYYSLRTRDMFVGILFTIAWFLFAYRGYDDRDATAGKIACIFALGVAIFPNSGTPLEGRLHYGCAAALFLVLSYFALALFTKTGGSPTPNKLIRNRVYRTCGVIMLACIAAIGLGTVLLAEATRNALRLVFWLEALALWAFGVSWFVKGETLWRDAEA